MKQVVFKCDIADLPPVRAGDSCAVYVTTSPLRAVALFPLALSRMGVLNALRLVLRLCRRGRLFYWTAEGCPMSHWGSITLGWCRYYEVGQGSAVFGPVETCEQFRGKGIASRTMRCAMGYLSSSGVRSCYVDTSEANLAMQRAAEKAGFRDTGLRFER